jgi:DNA primase
MPKALTYPNEDEEQLSWYFSSNPSAPTVLVEDIPSAVRAATYINAVSLLGTTVGEDKAQEIRKHAKGRIIIALDQDAVDQAMALAKRYRMLWDYPEVLPLQQDLKDMDEAELWQLLSRFKQQSSTSTKE